MENAKQLLDSFDIARFGTMTENLYSLTEKRYSRPTQTLRASHPRVCLTAEMLPAIRAALDNPDCAAAAEVFRTYVETDYTGILDAPETDHDGRKGLHNYDKKGLAIIEAKALNYQLTGDSRCGCEALLAMFNYIDTMDIQWISSDHCREYGYAMFIAAEVYDWCYDLMTPEQRLGMIAGVETRFCAGQVGYPDFTTTDTYKMKMEVLFPPTGQGGVNGHGSEGQLLRDYLSFAIAIYDENPSWWEFCAGRLQDEYIPVRLEFYKADFYPQGTSCYLRCRFFSDLYSAWLYIHATGENPYTGIGRVIPGLFATQVPNESSFYGSGDGGPLPQKDTYGRLALLSAAITGKPTDWALAKNAHAFEAVGTGHAGVTASAMLIFSSGGTASTEDSYASLPVQSYNGAWLGMLTSRARWHDADAPSLQLKVGVRSTANHDHGDGGSFQIYYKGLLTHDGGRYSNFGHYQTRFYHGSTVAHNCVLIVDPAKVKPDSTVPAEKWYSGSQRIRMSVENWANSDLCKTGVVTGMQMGCKDDARTEADYAYLAGDITAAYDEAEYAGRRMLAVYTDDKAFPMVLFIHDDITSAGADFEKKFLLQIPSPDAPEIDGNTVITERGGGQLRLISLTENGTLEGVGGEGRHHWINGSECRALGDTIDSHWGRVEITLPTGEKDGSFLSVLCVTDAGNTAAAPATVRITGSGITGASFDSTAALFALSRTGADSALKATLPGCGTIRCFLCGLKAGSWTIAAGGKTLTTCTASEEGGMIVFNAPAGEITVVPV